MTDSSNTPGLNDLMALFGGTNPLSLIGKSINQFQAGISNFLHSIENFNETMEQMNGVAKRINTMLDDLEPVVKAAVPQLTRTLKAADEMVESMSVPIERVAPALMRLSETLSSPVLTDFPRDLGQFIEMFGDVARRMQPLGQLAETAGGFFGLNPLAALRSATSPPPRQAPRPASPPPPAVFDEVPPPPPAPERTATRSSAEKAAAKRSPAKKSAAKKASAKKTAAKKTTGTRSR
jgi:hypothetical protein